MMVLNVNLIFQRIFYISTPAYSCLPKLFCSNCYKIFNNNLLILGLQFVNDYDWYVWPIFIKNMSKYTNISFGAEIAD